MKIENIIDDIKNDITELSNRLEEQFRNANPHLNFAIGLPDIEELNTIKSVTLSVEENNAIYYLSVHIHTHNGNRVFENMPKAVINKQLVPFNAPYEYQDQFLAILRDIIRKKKNRIKSGNKPGPFFNDGARQYAQSD